MKPTKQLNTTNSSESFSHVKSFISNIANKDYKEASTSLHSMVEAKLKEKIKSTLTPKN